MRRVLTIIAVVVLVACSSMSPRSGSEPGTPKTPTRGPDVSVRLLRQEPPNRPDWAVGQKSFFEREGRYFFVGEAWEKDSADLAKDAARRVAVEQLAAMVGLEVTSVTKIEEELKDGQTMLRATFQSQLRSIPFRVEELQQEGLYWEKWQRADGIKFDGKYCISVPKEQVETAKRMAQGKVVIAWHCSVDPLALCDESLLDPIRAAVNHLFEGKVGPNVAILGGDEDGCLVGPSHDAAFLLLVHLSAKMHSEEDGVHYAYGKARADFINTAQCTSKPFSVERQKGARFTAEEATQEAMAKALEELAAELKYTFK